MKKSFLFILSIWLFTTSLAQQKITPATALDAYLNNSDPTWAWEVRNQYQVGETQAYSIVFISQKWQGILWKHELIVFVPKKISYDGVLLFITGGSLADGIPRIAKPDDYTSIFMANIAERNNSITAVLHQVPNQPLYNGKTEDALISFTLNEFRKDGDFSWPLLFPMVKSATKSMSVIQEFAKQKTDSNIKRFVVSGASKRGWTAWLTGASRDPRVAAIAPMVIDILNMPATLTDQQKDYNYSEEIADYVALEIPQAINSEFGNSIVQMIDPFSYRSRLTMPKMIFMGANDPYWTIDAAKHYIDKIPGHNLLCYIANVGHNLGDGKKAFESLSVFFNLTINNKPYPDCKTNVVDKNGKMTFEINISNCHPLCTLLWTAESGNRDFRKSKWTEKTIESKKIESIKETFTHPKKGFRALFFEIVCEDSNGREYSLTTRTYVLGE